MPDPVTAILVAAGRSSRMGSDKLWIDIWGRPTWRWSLDALLAVPAVERVAIAVPADAVARYREALPNQAVDRCEVVPGGEARADSVIAGIVALAAAGYDDEALVLVHDAARPAVTGDLIASVIDAASAGRPVVIPVVPVVDSLKRVRGERVIGAVERDEAVAAQTPQAARLGALRAAIEEAHAWGRPVTDDAGALAAAGVPVHVVPGDPINHKLTTPADLVAMRAVLAEQAMPVAPSGPLPASMRSGMGFDAHRLAAHLPMVIAGVAFPDEDRGPEGHSDGDAALHALVDALLGAAGMGDIGSLFPADDDAWAGADSAELVRTALGRVRQHGWQPLSADLAVAVASPAIAPRRAELEARVAELLDVDSGAVSVKGTTTDGLGITGADGIAAWAVVLLQPA